MSAPTVLPLTVLAWEGPQARAYLVRMRRAGIRPARVVLMVRDPLVQRVPALASLRGSLMLRRGERAQDRSHNYHPYAIRKQHPELVRRIGAAMEALVADPLGLYDEMFDQFSWDAQADDVTRIAAASYRDPAVPDALRAAGGGTVLFTGGGIVPQAVFDVPGIRLVHVHTGFLPHVRGADVLLWSLLTRGRPGVSAFLMTPGLDDGDVLAARELEPLRVELPGGDTVDDETLYRSVFSFIDPLIRAELLVTDVFAPAGPDLAGLSATPQDLDVGVTYHFMHPMVRSRALRHLFAAPRMQAQPRATTRIGSPQAYERFYAKPSPVAGLRFAIDAVRAGSSLRGVGIRNRQHDYARASGQPRLLALHRELNHQLALQEREWDSYDYGEGYFYQSSEELGITGLRDTRGRVDAFGLRDLVAGRNVLEIGCNTGFLTLAIAPSAGRVVAMELNPYLVAIARAGAQYLGIGNVDLRVAAFEDLQLDETFDDVLSFANHHTYDGNTRQSLDEYFARCHRLTRPGGRLIFESHPPELEGDRFGATIRLIERYYDLERGEVHQYGTVLDRNRRFLVGVRRDEPAPVDRG